MSFWFYSHVILGSCLEMIGIFHAMNESAGLPQYGNGYDCQMGCTTDLVGQPQQVPNHPELCWMPAPLDYQAFVDATCQTVDVEGVEVQTPCGAEIIETTAAPCEYLEHFDTFWCPGWAVEYEICSRPARNCE